MARYTFRRTTRLAVRHWTYPGDLDVAQVAGGSVQLASEGLTSGHHSLSLIVCRPVSMAHLSMAWLDHMQEMAGVVKTSICPYGASEMLSGGQTCQLLTVMLTPELSVIPAELEASADKTYEPLGTFAVFQLHKYPNQVGPAVQSIGPQKP